MNDRDKTRLYDMLDAAYKARAFAANRTRESLHEDDMLAFALVRAIEIVGEAASRVTQATREALPQIPWKAITGMRNKVIHDYVAIDYDVVWDTVNYDLPELIEQLQTILKADET